MKKSNLATLLVMLWSLMCTAIGLYIGLFLLGSVESLEESIFYNSCCFSFLTAGIVPTLIYAATK